MTVSISFSVPTPDKVAQESIANLDYYEVEDTMFEGSIEIAANGHRISIEDVPLLHFAHWGLWESR